MATHDSQKPIHSIVVDTGPLIKNSVSISTIIGSAEVLYTTPAIIAEIRDPATRSRVETTLMPFLNVKTPSPASYDAVAAFAKKTGDFEVLSRQDLGILALAYEVHCEKHGGPWELRSVPKGPLNLSPEHEEKAVKEAAEKKARKEDQAAKQAKNEAKKAENIARAEAKKEAKEKAKKETAKRQERSRRQREARKQKWKAISNSEQAAAEIHQSSEPVSTLESSQQEVKPSNDASKAESTNPTPTGEPSHNSIPRQQPSNEESQAEDVTVHKDHATETGTIHQDSSNEPTATKQPVQQEHHLPEKALDVEHTERKPELTAESLQQSALVEESLVGDQEETVEENPAESKLADPISEAQIPSEHATANCNGLKKKQDRSRAKDGSAVETGAPASADTPEKTQTTQVVSEETASGQATFKYNTTSTKKKRNRTRARPAAEEVAPTSAHVATTLEPTPPATSDDSDSDSEPWITTDNLAKNQAKDAATAPLRRKGAPQLPVAIMTTDYAMQNVLLQMNMQLISPAMQRVKQLRTTIMRCHACFLTTKEMEKQFCPRCGQPTLQRVSCSTSADGEVQIHLSKKYQHSKRGDRFSIPKPVGGTSNGKMREKGGGKGGWGRELVLSEDQKEYQRKNGEMKREKGRDLMDEDYLPGILTGERGKGVERVRVGAGKDVNSRKRF